MRSQCPVCVRMFDSGRLDEHMNRCVVVTCAGDVSATMIEEARRSVTCPGRDHKPNGGLR